MERERLNHLMQDPARVAKEDLAGLAELTTRYPWFSAAHLLLAVGEHTAGEVLYDERARTAAAHLPMRSVLFDLVHQEQVPVAAAEPAPYTAWMAAPMVEAPAPPAPIPTPAPEPVAVAVEAVAPVMHVVDPIQAPPAPPAPAVEVPLEPVTAWVAPPPVVEPVVEANTPLPSVAESVVVLPSTPVAPVDVIAPAPPAPLAAASEAPVEPEADPLDALIRQAAFAGTYELLLENEVEAPAPPAAPAPAPEVERPAAAAIVPPPPPRTAAPQRPTGKLSFLDWLEQAGPSEAAPVAASSPAHADWIRSTEPAIAAPIAAQPEPAPPAPAEVPATKPKGGMSVLDAASLIDSFIRQEHPEPPKRTEFFNPQTAAKRSLEEHVELVTETLARIYEQQGNTAKALAAYRKLAERHPERREHFLGLAKALEGKSKT